MAATEVVTLSCTQVVLSAQRRTRAAFFLSIAASCVVLITVFNLTLSRAQETFLLGSVSNDAVKTLQDEHMKHQVDRYYYQLPVLGIQLTCDDLMFFGPLALCVLSFFSLIAFRTLNHHIKCIKCACEDDQPGELIMDLLAVELVPWGAPADDRRYICPTSHFASVVMFLPLAACLSVVGYRIHSYFASPYWPGFPPLYRLMLEGKMPTFWPIVFDCLGLFLTALVGIYNLRAAEFAKEALSNSGAKEPKHHHSRAASTLRK